VVTRWRSKVKDQSHTVVRACGGKKASSRLSFVVSLCGFCNSFDVDAAGG